MAAAAPALAIGNSSEPPLARVVRLSGAVLVAASWISAAAFGLYIFAFYLGAIPAHRLDHWNDNLTGVYAPHHPAAFLGMTAHLATGAIILLLGPVQLLGSIRRRWPALHRWIGRLYVFTSAIAGTGGLIFIFTRGTIGGWRMSIGFGLYGFLMVLAAVETYRHALARRFDRHRAWAMRLFALAVGSWLYRMDYGLWLTAAPHHIGHHPDFHGPFDVIMAFFFYLPNLLLVELFLRARSVLARPIIRITAAILLNAASLVVIVGSYYFIRFYWGPAIVSGFLGQGAI